MAQVFPLMIADGSLLVALARRCADVLARLFEAAKQVVTSSYIKEDITPVLLAHDDGPLGQRPLLGAWLETNYHQICVTLRT